jgi:hypothetical protein
MGVSDVECTWRMAASGRTFADDVSLVRGGVEPDEGLGEEGLPFEVFLLVLIEKIPFYLRH